MKRVCVDFSAPTRRIKPLHGVNNSPDTYGEKIPTFEQAGIPYARLHDTMGQYGGTCFVDVPNIFPRFEADENDPASYTFEFTDAYLKGLTASGCKIFYRLGVTIENNFHIRRMRSDPPADFEKWARICERIVAHYNEGWANGPILNIEYWEIWNEPENPPMWSGTREQYFELYRITANRLKKRFPNIKVGGYAGCGFYCVTRENMGEFYESFMDWFDAFLAEMSAPDTRAPVDFFSWHLYTDDPREIDAHAKYVEGKLFEYGYTNTENIFNEWNYLTNNKTRFDDMKGVGGAAFVGAAFALLQNGPVDKAMYYDAFPRRAYCGLYTFPGQETTKTYSVFKAYNELYKLGSGVTAESDDTHVYPVAATNGDAGAILISAFGAEADYVEVDMRHLVEGEKEFSVYRVDADNSLALDRVEYFTSGHAKQILRLDGEGVLLVQWCRK